MINRIVSVLLLSAICAFTAEYHVDKSQERKVRFISEAPVENFDGVTEEIDGYALVDDDDPTAQNEFYFQVQLDALDTGIGLRNRHMRDNYLETEKYPLAELRGKVVQVDSTDSNAFSAQTTGTFKLHGVEKAVEIDGVVTNTAPGEYKIESTFEVNLQDYDIKVPQLMIVKISEIIKLEITFSLVKVQE